MAASIPAPIVVNAEDAEKHLLRLGLCLADIIQALKDGEVAKANVDAFHPVTFPGINRWGAVTASIRGAHVRRGGWRYEDPQNRALLVHESMGHSFIAYQGNEYTGTGVSPNLQRRKGPAFGAAHPGQDPLPLEIFKAPEMRVRDEWILLYYRAGDVIRAEVSLPAGSHEGYVTGWTTRIILPVIELEEGATIPDTFGGDDVDFGIKEA